MTEENLKFLADGWTCARMDGHTEVHGASRTSFYAGTIMNPLIMENLCFRITNLQKNDSPHL